MTRKENTPTSAPAWWKSPRVASGAGVVLAAALVLIVYSVQSKNSQSSSPTPNPTQSSTSALLASAATTVSGATTDGIQCGATESVAFHIHAHLAVYVNGQQDTIPEGIGIVAPQETQSANGPFADGGTCLYWLHSHTADGIIHIESPIQASFTLGEYFDIWGQPLSASQVGPAKGSVIAYVNGSRYPGDPRTIPLNAHAVIQLDVGQDVAPQPFSFPSGL